MKTLVLTLLPILVLNSTAVAEKDCSVGDVSGAMPCCTGIAARNQVQVGFAVPESCTCHLADNSSTGNQAAILPDISKPRNKDGDKIQRDVSALELVFRENISTRQPNNTTTPLSFSNIKIYDLNTSYLI
ncbi:MAG: hypothetical protein ACE5IR_25640 [bacterium]